MPAIKFRGVDFIAFDSLLSDDERLVRDTTRKFIEDNLIPIIEECNRAGRFPRELVKPMADRSVEHPLTTQAGLIIGTPGYRATAVRACRTSNTDSSHRNWSVATPACVRLSACNRRW